MISSLWRRRRFLQIMGLAGSGILTPFGKRPIKAADHTTFSTAGVDLLPMGHAPQALAFPHFPSRLHAFVWRNWQLVPIERLAKVVGAQPEDILVLAQSMGLDKPPLITSHQQRRSYITVIRRNWHILPYEQLLCLLDCTPDELAFTLREDDFLYQKLGRLKPKCEPLRFTASSDAIRRLERKIFEFVRNHFATDFIEKSEPLFRFVDELSSQAPAMNNRLSTGDRLSFCYSYFALYGDPLLDKDIDPYPDGYLARLAATGVNGVWLQAVLHKLAPCPWQPERSARYQERLQNLSALITRAAGHGVKVFLYLNEPRALPVKFFENHPELKGVVENEYAALCTSVKEVQNYLTDAIASICKSVPDLGGFFTITASENLTNCWSRGAGKECPRCSTKMPAEVIANVNNLVAAGIAKAGGKQRLLVWDWGWDDAWACEVIERLPANVSLMSVSEWSLPIERGGVKSTVGEYSISAVGPGPRARKHWALARQRGLSVIAKIQAGNTWELSSIPYIPALALIEEHARNLRDEKIDGLMLGWTLGGYPSPNLETIAQVLAGGELSTVALRRFGATLAPFVLNAWKQCSIAFREFPFDIMVLYFAPLQYGPSNLLWGEPTNYASTMAGFHYDDLDAWRSIYPAETFITQLEKVGSGFSLAGRRLKQELAPFAGSKPAAHWMAANSEQQLMAAAALHWQSVANQAQFIKTRQRLQAIPDKKTAQPLLTELAGLLHAEMKAALELYQLQTSDSRIGFEASNQYYYVPMDLVEKMLNCQDLLDRWLPAITEKLGKTKS